MPGWEQLGMQAASQGISGALGLLLGGINDRRQLRQQEKLQGLQIRGNKELTDYNFMKQMEMWKNTNYPAQMAMLKAAGLNPALMYEGGGQGGSTGITQGSITGANAPTGGGEIMQMMGMGLTRDLQLAQIENIKAQTDKTKAETGAVAPGIEKTKQETLNLQTQNAIAELEKAFQSDTLQNRESLVNISLSKLIEETRIMENNREISDETKANQIKQIAENLKNTITQGLGLEKQNAKTDKERDQIDAQINAINQQIDINKLDQEMSKDGFNPKTGTIFKTMYNIYKFLRQLL